MVMEHVMNLPIYGGFTLIYQLRMMISNDFHSYFKLLEGNIVTWPEIGDMHGYAAFKDDTCNEDTVIGYWLLPYTALWKSMGFPRRSTHGGFSIS